MEKTLLTLLTLGVLALPSLAFADITSETDTFTDVQYGDDDYLQINWLKEQGIISGYPDGSFHPDDTINRAELSKIVSIATNPETPTATDGGDIFTDLDYNTWYSPYVQDLYSRSIISGYSDSSFKPDNEVNFAEAAKIVIIAYDWPVIPVTGAWYQPYVDKLNLFQGIPDSIQSYDQLLTRREMAQLPYNLEVVTGF